MELRDDLATMLERTRPGGVQRDRDGTPLFILRHCLRCGSTLCLDPDLVPDLVADLVAPDA